MEKRFIDADYVKKMAEASYNEDMTEWERGWNDACNAIADYAPTADAAEIVRCKYCKHYDFSRVNIVITAWGTCRAIGIYTPQTHYCSFGERREDA